MKRFFFWLVMVCGGGVLAWSVYAIEIGGLENVVQTIRNVVITSDGAVAKTNKSNVIMNINDPQGNDANRIYIKKGSFKDRSIVKEDIDWESIFSGSNYFSCAHKGEGYALQKMDYPNDATCVYVGDYRQPTDPQDKKGAIYYSGGVGIDIPGGVKKDSFVRSGKRVQGNAQFLVKDRLSPKGAIIVGKKDKYMALTSDNGAAVLDVVNNVSGQKPQLVMGADTGVSIGGDVLMSSAKLSVHGNVHADKTLEIHDPTKGSMKTSVSSDKTTITLTNKNFFIGGGVKDANATKLSRRGSVAHAWSWSDAGLVVGSTNSSSTPHAPLTVNGGLSVRGQGEKGGVGIGGFVGTVDLKSNGCRVASIDATGKVVMKAVAGCYYVTVGPWGGCYNARRTRSVSCRDGSGASVAFSLCQTAYPQSSKECSQCGSSRHSCSSGRVGNLTETTDYYRWTCSGYSTSVNCSAHKPVNGVCGPNMTCVSGSLSISVEHLGGSESRRSWSCGGIYGGTDSGECGSNSQDGVCGSTKYTCSQGTYTNGSTTSTQYRWACSGANGGKTANCSVPKESPRYDIYACQSSGSRSQTSSNQSSGGSAVAYSSSTVYSVGARVYVRSGASAPSNSTCRKAALPSDYYCGGRNGLYTITTSSFSVSNDYGVLCKNGARILGTERFSGGSYVCKHPTNGQSSCRVTCSSGNLKYSAGGIGTTSDDEYLKCEAYRRVSTGWSSCGAARCSGTYTEEQGYCSDDYAQDDGERAKCQASTTREECGSYYQGVSNCMWIVTLPSQTKSCSSLSQSACQSQRSCSYISAQSTQTENFVCRGSGGSVDPTGRECGTKPSNTRSCSSSGGSSSGGGQCGDSCFSDADCDNMGCIDGTCQFFPTPDGTIC